MNKLMTAVSDVWGWVRAHPDKVARFARDNPLATTVMVVAIVAGVTTAIVAVFA